MREQIFVQLVSIVHTHTHTHVCDLIYCPQEVKFPYSLY